MAASAGIESRADGGIIAPVRRCAAWTRTTDPEQTGRPRLPHSAFSVATGATVAARHAGTRQARAPTSASRSTATGPVPEDGGDGRGAAGRVAAPRPDASAQRRAGWGRVHHCHAGRAGLRDQPRRRRARGSCRRRPPALSSSLPATLREGRMSGARSGRGLLVALVLAACALAAIPAAQQKPTFRTGVEIVAIDVNVVDRTARPVADLIAADFTVSVDRRP